MLRRKKSEHFRLIKSIVDLKVSDSPPRAPRKRQSIKEQADAMGGVGKVEVYIAPCDVMKNSDIVFSCSLDPECAKKNVFGNCGVTKQDNDTLDGKGYVEMTGIDAQTSSVICEEIMSRGGRYLEAQIQGSREEAEVGSLVILTAGEKSLFVDCQSCFKAMGKTSLYLGEVGLATKVYLILQLMKGIALVGLAEGLVLADRCGISAKDIVDIFNMTELSCPYLQNKANIIINKDFKKVEQSIQNMQKDIKLALGLSDEYMQPLMMASAANEVYKHSRKLGYDEHDCACIYMKARSNPVRVEPSSPVSSSAWKNFTPDPASCVETSRWRNSSGTGYSEGNPGFLFIFGVLLYCPATSERIN
ncbi:hypothetical protein GWI33_016187 [Rhynchophorus ferrugineus]|uniref:Uncharacterized protein n=1 Tax=Rhynchophorus ferrugineus TaxID=354439 RepID=A0A834M8Y0_RHYFE|nr:hypothetical protein GWI33_016187 [Rhynchophorus ferrugineus]